MSKSGYDRRVLVVISFSVVLIVTLALQQEPWLTAQNERSKDKDYGSEMTRQTDEGHYEEAIQIGLSALRNKPSDAGVYRQIAIVYLIRAQKDTAQRQAWLEKATDYEKRALAIDPDNPMSVIEQAIGFETAGDLSINGRCGYYRQSVELAQKVARLLQADHITAGGKTYPIDPVRKEFTAYGRRLPIAPMQRQEQAVSERVRTKIKNSNCGT